jgi:hypothetical protein
MNYSVTVTGTDYSNSSTFATMADALDTFEAVELEAGQTIVLRDLRTDAVLVIYREEFAHVTTAA